MKTLILEIIIASLIWIAVIYGRDVYYSPKDIGFWIQLLLISVALFLTKFTDRL